MKQNIRVITLKKDVPVDTVSRDGFHLLNMGKEGTWLVDEAHPGYRRCVQKAIQLAIANKDAILVEKYSLLPKGLDPKPFKKLPYVIEAEKKANEEAKKDK